MVKKSVVDIKKNICVFNIIEEIYKSGQVTIATLAKKLHTSVPSITVIVNELIELNWLFEVGYSRTSSGRRPILYDINPQKRKVMVIDINIFETRFFVLDLRNNIIHQDSMTLSIQDETLISKINEKATEITALHDIWVVGISSPGLISTETDINHSYSNHNLNNKSICANIEELLHIPTFLNHDTQAAIMGEHHFGAAKGLQNVLLVNFNWGLGMGILSNGRLVKGVSGFAGELGHIQMNPDGDLCQCGKRGCLETQASALALFRKAERGIASGVSTSLSSKEKLWLEDIIDAAISGDEFSIDLILEVGKELGKGLAVAVHMFNPEIVIIDGLLSKAGELLLTSLSQSINKYCIPDFKKDLQIQMSSMNQMSKVFGVKSLVFCHMLHRGIM